MGRLLVSGCSFTEHDPRKDKIKRRWSHYVADKLGMELTNLGFSGAGNEYIFCSLYDEIQKGPKPDMVIAAWSKAERRDYQVRGKHRNDRLDLRGDHEYFIARTNRYKELLRLVCDHHGIEYHSFQMIELFDKDRDNVQAKTIGFLRHANEDFISEEDRHPSAIGHKKIGIYIHEHL